MTIVECPALDPPPAAAIDALEAASPSHPEIAGWADKLDRHYQKLDACNQERKSK